MTRSRLRAWLGWDPLLLGAIGVAVFAMATIAGWQLQDGTSPVQGRIFAGSPISDDSPAADVAGVISTADGARVTIQAAAGPVTVQVPPAADVQVLVPATPADAQAGDWLVIGALDDNFNTFVLQGAVLVAPGEVQP